MRRLPATAHGAVFGLAMAVFYSGLMSGLFSARAHGLEASTLPVRLGGWALAFAIAAPAGLVLRPAALKAADLLTGPDRSRSR